MILLYVCGISYTLYCFSYLIILQILNVIALYGAQKNISGPLVAHRQIEAIKHAFAKRMNLGDPDFVNIEKDLADMISPKVAQQLKKTIYDNKTFGSTHYGGKYAQFITFS